MTDILVLGAGASYGSGDCLPEAPPLGARLFDALRARGGVAATVSPELAVLFAEDFERGMVAFREQRDRDTTALLREMAAFLAEFTAGPGNVYHQLVAAIREAPVWPVLVTTNYDLLIEQAVTEAGLRVAYHRPPVPTNNVSLLKIHGSCHFLPVVRGVMRGVVFDGCGVNVEVPIRFASSRAEVKAFCATQDSLAPAVSLYAPGKDVLFSSKAVKAQQAEWQAALDTATRVFLIGLRVVEGDDHIWGALARAKPEVVYVGFEPTEFLEWAARVGLSRAHVLARTFAEAVPLLRGELQQP